MLGVEASSALSPQAAGHVAPMATPRVVAVPDRSGRPSAEARRRSPAALRPARAKLLSLRGLLGGEALSLPYYRHRAMRDWIAKSAGKGDPELDEYLADPEAYIAKNPLPWMDDILNGVDLAVPHQRGQLLGRGAVGLEAQAGITLPDHGVGQGLDQNRVVVVVLPFKLAGKRVRPVNPHREPADVIRNAGVFGRDEIGQGVVRLPLAFGPLLPEGVKPGTEGGP